MKESVRKELYKVLKRYNWESAKEIDWNCIAIYKDISEQFLAEFKDKIDWKYISEYQKLSEKFIKEFKDKVNWRNISEKQRLSGNFIYEFRDRLNIDTLIKKGIITKKRLKEIEKKETVQNRFEILDIR